MKGQHDYQPSCMCYRCKGIRNSPSFKPKKRARKPKSQHASPEEQHARLIDCGYNNWDDRGDY